MANGKIPTTCVLLSPVASAGAVSAPLALSVSGALAAPLAVAALPDHGAVLVLLAFALVIFQVDAMTVLRTGLNLTGQPSSTSLPLSEDLGVAFLQWHAGRSSVQSRVSSCTVRLFFSI